MRYEDLKCYEADPCQPDAVPQSTPGACVYLHDLPQKIAVSERRPLVETLVVIYCGQEVMFGFWGLHDRWWRVDPRKDTFEYIDALVTHWREILR